MSWSDVGAEHPLAEPQPPQCCSSAHVKELHQELHLPCATPTMRAAASHENIRKPAHSPGSDALRQQRDGRTTPTGRSAGRSPPRSHTHARFFPTHKLCVCVACKMLCGGIALATAMVARASPRLSCSGYAKVRWRPDYNSFVKAHTSSSKRPRFGCTWRWTSRSGFTTERTTLLRGGVFTDHARFRDSHMYV